MMLYAGTTAYREGVIDVLPWRRALAEVAGFLR